MAKKKETKKITNEELEKVQGFVNALNQGQTQVGGLESQKYDLLNQMSVIRQELQKFQVELQEKYGDVSINLADGTISDADNTED